MDITYSLFRRKGQTVYYFAYVKGGKRIYRSTGETIKRDAKKYADKYLKEKAKEKVLFGDFAKDFYIWDSCPWIKKQHGYGRRFSKEHAKSKRALLLNYLLPQFGNRYIHEITKADIEGFLTSDKLKHLAAQSKNHILNTLRQIMREAEDQGIIEYSIVDRVRGFTVRHKQKGVFTLDELKTLFPDDEKEMLHILWDVKHAALFLILASTGIRSGEVRGLFWGDYLREHRALFIQRAVKDNAGTIGETKTGEKRLVLLSDKAIKQLEAWEQLSPCTTQHELIFYGEEPSRAYTRRAISHSFNQALSRAGIEKRDRTPHSFRHTFNTLFRNVLPDYILRELTGHKTEKMTGYYDNPGIDDLVKRIAPARAAIERMF